LTVSAKLTVLVATAITGFRDLGCRPWCRSQRRRLHARDHQVVWVRDGKKMQWARWGVDHGYFEMDWAGRLPYLRALAAVG